MNNMNKQNNQGSTSKQEASKDQTSKNTGKTPRPSENVSSTKESTGSKNSQTNGKRQN